MQDLNTVISMINNERQQSNIPGALALTRCIVLNSTPWKAILGVPADTATVTNVADHFTTATPEIAHELRIGNIHKGKEFSIPRLGILSDSVDGIHYEMITAYGIHLVSEGRMAFEPIPLSVNWLIKLGFKKEGMSWSNNDFNVSEWPDGRFDYFGKQGLYISYVHQLQNLFFAITGNELTNIM